MPTIDADLRSVQQARDLAVAAKNAQREFATADQATVDRICKAMVDAAMREAGRLGQMAHDETGYGYAAHKKLKNEFAAQSVWDSIKDVPTCGILKHDEANRVIEIGAPVGVVVALTPSTNPTSTAIFKSLICVKARNGIIVAPHPAAAKSTAEAVRVIAEAGEAAGMPKGLVSCMTELSIGGTNELMNHYATSMILATGGPGMVKAAHSCGKPAIGVGPGNVPAYVDRSADVEAAARMIVQSKSFDCSTICATEQAVIADKPIADRMRAAMKAEGAHWLTAEEADKLGRKMFRPNGMLNGPFAGRTPQDLGKMVGIPVPEDARILVAELGGIGPDFPLSREKLTSVLGFMEADGWEDGCEKSLAMLRFGGDGHSLSIHSNDEKQIMRFAFEKPAYRMLVNTWSSLGGVGYTTGLKPSFTLAPGGVGGAVVSDNVSVHNVLNVRRLAYHLNDAPAVAQAFRGGAQGTVSAPTTGSDSDTIERVVRLVLNELKK